MMVTKIQRICWLAFMLMLMLMVSITGCGDGDGDSSPTSPTTETATVEWSFRTNYSVSVHLQFYSQDRDWVWPSADEVFVIPNDDQARSITTTCNKGEQLCYGAWPSDGRGGGWGVGRNNTESCDACCTTCEDKTIQTVRLTG